MRIISGKYKGRKLVAFDFDHIRPTTDRVKGSLFNIWAPLWDGSKVLDLYSGTGGLGFEALSRGAQSVDFVDQNIKSIGLINKNKSLLGVNSGITIHKQDAVVFLEKYQGEPFDLILIDPPFTAQICSKTLEALAKSKAQSAQTKTVIEHSKHEPLADIYGELRCVDRRKSSDKILSFYEVL